MAKKTFCDGCGDEMSYSETQPLLKGDTVTASFNGHEGRYLKFEVSVKFVPMSVRNGEHIDFCGACRLHLLKKITPQLGELNEQSII